MTPRAPDSPALSPQSSSRSETAPTHPSPLTPHPSLEFTPAQRQAIETIDRSVLVSAAAGAGKTAVLAERCAYLVCDAPPDRRCDIDRLLVVTFTENAAAEMKARIRKTLQARLRQRPDDARLREQLDLLETARISTLHAFGLWVLRRWFNQADLDPAAPLLDEHEALLLRAETLDGLFERLYAENSAPADAFRALIEGYGLGDDRAIRRFILHLAAFLESIPEPESWLDHALALITSDRSALLRHLCASLAEDLEGQLDYCQRAAAHIAERLSDFAFYGDLLEHAATHLSAWRLALTDSTNDAALCDSLRRVQAALAAHKFSTKGSPQVASDAPQVVHERRERARTLWQRFHDDLFKGRLQKIVARYSPEDWFASLDRIAPHARAVMQLAQDFRRAYAAAKQDHGILDFADLERKTHELLVRHPEMAADLRRRFQYVLVDEFQDINPLQETVLRLVSREGEPRGLTPRSLVEGTASHSEEDGGKPRRSLHAGNLFVVGDVRQSIYRFRLAEPAIFLRRQADLNRPESGGECIHLQKNYRSHAHILNAVNEIFRRLMIPQIGGIAYDASAEMVGAVSDRDSAAQSSSRSETAPTHHSPLTTHSCTVEVHLLQRRWVAADEPAPDNVDPEDPAEWTAAQREAYLIAQRIRALIAERLTKKDGSPVSYRDIAVLLRAASHTASPMARMLSACGVPARADVGGEFFSAVEVQDILSLLRVLDNFQQDIELAAVLRSPVLGDPLNEDDLVELRLLDRAAPFHEVVRRYPEEGKDAGLRERAGRLLQRVERYRLHARQRPLADTVWRLYHDHGYLAWAGGLTNAAARRANLLKLHELARRFGTFQRQGLHRFLRFLDALHEHDMELGAAPALSAAEDVVRVMSIHRSKGLEFPVVFVADLGRRFNLSDASGRLIFDRELGLGLRTVDTERMIEYPSLAHHLVCGRIHLHTRAEELRILYVALTRAMQRLILIGSGDLESLRLDYALHAGSEGPLSALAIRTATTPLDWLIPALAAMPEGAVLNSQSAIRNSQFPGPLFSVQTYDEQTMSGWSLEPAGAESEQATRRAAAKLEPLPPHEPHDAPPEVVARIFDRLDYVYPNLAAASVPAVIAATELSKGRAWLRDPEERMVQSQISNLKSQISDTSLAATRRGAFTLGPTSTQFQNDAPGREVSTFAVGVATHRFLQHCDLRIARRADALHAESERLIALGRLTREEADAIDRESIAWFLGTDLAQRVRDCGPDYRRELMFLHRATDSLGPESSVSSPDSTLVRGVIDGVLCTDSGLEIIDYKTDHIGAEQAAERAAHYAPQLAAYAGAAAALYRQPVTARWLVFLHPRVVCQV